MKPILTSLSYSGGEQSHGLLEMVLRGHIERPENFVVLNANPGMEDERSAEFVEMARAKCKSAGIPFVTAKGGNLWEDLINLKNSGASRLDNPPYFIKKPNGKRGKLRHKCTKAYKIDPMKRALRQLMYELCGVSIKTSRPPSVETWIGFSADEADRRKESKTKYIKLRFPLVEKGITKAKMVGYYLTHNITRPPRSVCVACFANGLLYLKDMYFNRPGDWDKAVAIDNSVRDLSVIGIKGEVFVSNTLIPLKDLPAKRFLEDAPDYREHRCNSGACFI